MFLNGQRSIVQLIDTRTASQSQSSPEQSRVYSPEKKDSFIKTHGKTTHNLILFHKR
jgi:hypothetical protein